MGLFHDEGTGRCPVSHGPDLVFFTVLLAVREDGYTCALRGFTNRSPRMVESFYSHHLPSHFAANECNADRKDKKFGALGAGDFRWLRADVTSGVPSKFMTKSLVKFTV